MASRPGPRSVYPVPFPSGVGVSGLKQKAYKNAAVPGNVITVGAAGIQLLAYNDRRIYCSITNTSGNPVFYVLGLHPVLNGPLLVANGGSFELGGGLGPRYIGDIWAIAAVDSTVAVVEISDEEAED